MFTEFLNTVACIYLNYSNTRFPLASNQTSIKANANIYGGSWVKCEATEVGWVVGWLVSEMGDGVIVGWKSVYQGSSLI